MEIITTARQKKDHALIAISPFNSYFSVKNITRLLQWAAETFHQFNLFIMDGASKFNLMALGYDEEKAIKKTNKQDKKLKNKVIKSCMALGMTEKDAHEKIILLSQLSQAQRYSESYKRYKNIFETHGSFRNDCLGATRLMLEHRMETVSDEAVNMAVEYLLAELPLWFDIPYLLDLPSSVLVYKDLSPLWRKIYYHYNLVSPQQELLIKNVDE
jgi:cyclo(L-tyrosyl-L-tyrosyl) synthase